MKNQINQTNNQKMSTKIILFIVLLLLALSGCQQPQSPETYLNSAVDWIAQNSIVGDQVNWPQVRTQAAAMAAGAQTTADTYPALEFALDQLPGSIVWFNRPEQAADLRFFGLEILDTPDGAIVVQVDPNGPAAATGIAPGDKVNNADELDALSRDANEPSPWFYELHPQGETLDLAITTAASGEQKNISISPVERTGSWTPFGSSLPAGEQSLGLINLTVDSGEDGSYAPLVQDLIAGIDSPQNCGWIIDLRTTGGGDIWSYLAALGPFLGQGQMGGFQYVDGRQELWERRENRVYWDGNKRYESDDIEADVRLQNPAAPLALLTSPVTNLAGELVIVAFGGHENVRTFGEATRGHPHYQAVNTLSDGAMISISGAFAFDSQGTPYQGKITPDQSVAIDWSKIGQDDDPVIQAAREWLLAQPQCAP